MCFFAASLICPRYQRCANILFASTTRHARTFSDGELSLVDGMASGCCQHLQLVARNRLFARGRTLPASGDTVLCGNETGCNLVVIRDYGIVNCRKRGNTSRAGGVLLGSSLEGKARANNTVVSALRSGSCLDTQVMRLLRLLHFVAAERRFSYTSQHIPGSEM